MRLLALLSLVASASLLAPFGVFTASDAECPAQGAAAANAPGLILQQSEGDRRVRRPWPGSVARMATSSMIIKVDERNGGSTDFFVGYEEIAPGNEMEMTSITIHRIANGKLVEKWSEKDMVRLLQQIGGMPSQPH